MFDFNGAVSGENPDGDLFFDGTYLYGMTQYGGSNNYGTIFKIKPDGTGFLKLMDFTGLNGRSPKGSLISDGTFLYGMTPDGGSNTDGIIFKIMPDGTGFSVIHNFGATTFDGKFPDGNLIFDGFFLYGVTESGGSSPAGTLFEIKTDGTNYLQLYNFNSISGGTPVGTLISDGTYFYGMTKFGGASLLDDGTIFKIKMDGSSYSTLLEFSGAANGKSPWSSLITDGSYLYGMTYYGGINDKGAVFKIKMDGSGFSKIYDFTSSSGNFPWGSLTSDGSYLYGMTTMGGANGDGVIFKIDGLAGVEETSNNFGINISPNPANDNVNVDLGISYKENTKLNLYDIHGKLVYHLENLKGELVQIDLSTFEKGIYILSIVSDKEAKNYKVVKQ